MEKRQNSFLLIAILISASIGTMVVYTLVKLLFDEVNDILLIGICFAAFGLCIAVGISVAHIAKPLRGIVHSGIHWLALGGIPVVFFVLGCLFQWLYGLQYPLKQLQYDDIDDFILVMDNSNSMTWNDSNDMRKSATVQLVQNLESEQGVAFLRFGTNCTMVEELTLADDDAKQRISQSIDAIQSGDDGGTNIELALYTALDHVVQKGDPSRVRSVILISDGESYVRMRKVTDAFLEENVPIQSVGMNLQSPILAQLAEHTGGRYYTTGNMDLLHSILDDIQNNAPVKDRRILLEVRTGPGRKSVLLGLIRVISFFALGMALHVLAWAATDDDSQRLSFLIQGTATGVVSGLLIEFGFYLYIWGPLVQLATLLVLSLILHKYVEDKVVVDLSTLQPLPPHGMQPSRTGDQDGRLNKEFAASHQIEGGSHGAS